MYMFFKLVLYECPVHNFYSSGGGGGGANVHPFYSFVRLLFVCEHCAPFYTRIIDPYHDYDCQYLEQPV